MKKLRKMNRIIQILSLISFILVVVLAIQIFRMGILPLKLSIPIVIALVVLTLLVSIFSLGHVRRYASKLACTILVAVMAIGYGFGNYYIYTTSSMLTEVTSLTDQIKNTISVVTLADSDITTLDELEGKTLGTIVSLDQTGSTKALDDIEGSIQVETVEYDSLIEMVDALYDGDVDTILLNESLRGEVHDTESRTWANFNTETQVIHTTEYYTDRTTKVTESSNPVDVTSETFTVFISGNDSYGSLNETSRSDSNMLVTINPTTHKILLTSIPRDYYVTVACDSSAESSCPDGQDDKLTHTGLYGIETTIETIEENLDIEINYYARVNFSSLVNLVDALDGIDVEVEEGLAVDSFYSNSTLEGVTEGTNHLDGERALAYARERHAYVDGDAQRVKNQQQVIEAIVDKMTSASMITNYPEFADALSGAFETNMTSSDITSLVRLQLSESPDWTFESYTLTGESSTEYCATLGDSASVTIPDSASVQTAAAKVQAIIDGESSEDISEDDYSSSYNYGTSNDDDDEDSYNYDYSYDDSSYESNDVYYNTDDMYYQDEYGY